MTIRAIRAARPASHPGAPALSLVLALALAVLPAAAQDRPPISWEDWRGPSGEDRQRDWREPATLPPLQCTGTEPFWSMDLTTDEAVVEQAGGGGRTLDPAAPEPIANRVGEWVVALRDRSGRAADGFALIREDQCTNGRSGQTSPYDVVLIGVERQPVGGCCKPMEAAVGPLVDVQPRRAAPGEMVIVSGEGFPPNTDIMIVAGPPQSAAMPLLPARTDRTGRVRAEVPMPAAAARHQDYVFAIRVPGSGADATSAPVEVAQNGRTDQIEVTGTLTREGVECPAMRGDDGRLYTLIGIDLGRITPGERIRIRGRQAQMSVCMQGTTIDVTDAERVGR